MKHAGGVKRFGARYGLSVKKKLAKIEILKKEDKECPYCSHKSVKRLAVGIWFCKKCGKKFTGKAYTVVKELPKEEEPEEVPEETKEE